jgi:TolB protein
MPMSRACCGLAAAMVFTSVIAGSGVAAPRQAQPSGAIAFERSEPGGSSIWLTSADGQNQRRVATRGSASDPAWTPSGRLGYVAIRSSRFQIFDAQPTGLAPRQLTRDPLPKANPAWAPDGKRIAFEGGPVGRTDIYTLPASGGTPRPLTSGAGSDEAPAWSPDSTRIVFSSNRDGPYRLYLLRPGGRPTRLTSGPGEDLEPAWSLSGRLIAFTRQDEAGNYDVWTVDPRTRSTQRLTDDASQEFQPSWSPDSRHITFVSNREATPDDENYDIFVMSADGANQENISRNRAPEIAPAWAPRSVKPPSGFRVPSGALLTCSDGTDASQTLNGSNSPETICGAGGNDTIDGNGGDDVIYGQIGSDTIYGDVGNDTISGGDGVDKCRGGPGNDRIYCGSNADLAPNGYLQGDSDDDDFWSRDSYKDTLYGGTGADEVKLRDPADVLASGFP